MVRLADLFLRVMLPFVILNLKFIFYWELAMDSVKTLNGLLPITLSLEEKQRADVMKVTFKTVHHFFGGFSPSALWSLGSQRAS